MFVEDLGRCLPAKDLPRPGVERSGDGAHEPLNLTARHTEHAGLPPGGERGRRGVGELACRVGDRVVDGGAGPMPGRVYASINLLDMQPTRGTWPPQPANPPSCPSRLRWRRWMRAA